MILRNLSQILKTLGSILRATRFVEVSVECNLDHPPIDWQIKPQTLTGSSDSSRAIQEGRSVQRLGGTEWTCATYLHRCQRPQRQLHALRTVQCQQPIISKRIKRSRRAEVNCCSFDRPQGTFSRRLRSVRLDARRIIEDFDRLTERARASGAGTLGRIVVGLYKSLSQGRCAHSSTNSANAIPTLILSCSKRRSRRLSPAFIPEGSMQRSSWVIPASARCSSPSRSGRSISWSHCRTAIA